MEPRSRSRPVRRSADFVRTQIGPGLAKVALFAKYDGAEVDLSAAARSRRQARDLHAEESRGARARPPRRGAHRRVGRAAAVPRHAGDDRPDDRRRLLLRLRARQAVHARGPRGDREGRERGGQAGPAVRPQGGLARTRRSRCSAGSARSSSSRSSRTSSTRARRRCRSTRTATGSTSASARTVRRPAASA